jgi:hypothetical protein
MLSPTLITSAIAPALWIAPRGIEWALLALVGVIGGTARAALSARRPGVTASR